MSKNHELVSVIINCKNSEKYLKECIDSVLYQTYSNFEIILVNNNSSDGTKKIILSYLDKKIKYFELRSSLNLGAARNYALNKAKGKYIAFIDSDDVWYRNKLEVIVKKFSKNVGLIYSDVKYFDKKRSFNLYDARNLYGGNCFNNLLLDYSLCISSCVISNNIIKKNKIKFDSKLLVCEDLDFFLKVAYVSEVNYSKKVLVKYRIHSENLTIKLSELFFYEFEKIISNLVKKFKINSDIINKALSQNHINHCKFFWKRNQIKKAYKSLYQVKDQYFKAILYGVLIIFPFKLINFFYRQFSSIKIEFK